MARNPDKERAKACLRADIQNSPTGIIYESNATQQLIAVLTNLTAGSAIGADQRLISHCPNALLAYSNAIVLLSRAIAQVEQLQTEDPD